MRNKLLAPCEAEHDVITILNEQPCPPEERDRRKGPLSMCVKVLCANRDEFKNTLLVVCNAEGEMVGGVEIRQIERRPHDGWSFQIILQKNIRTKENKQWGCNHSRKKQ